MKPRCPSVGPDGYRCRRRVHGPVPPEPMPPIEECHRAFAFGQTFAWDDETQNDPPDQHVSMGAAEVTWDVSRLIEQAAGQPVHPLPVALYVDPENVNRRFSYWRDVDIHTPVILAPHPDTGDYVVLDGRHRLYKAWKRGKGTVPAVFLTREQEIACRLSSEDAVRIEEEYRRFQQFTRGR